MAIDEHGGDDAAELAPADLEPRGLEPRGVEPLGLESQCSEEEFAEEVRDLVASSAPRVFALVEEYGERVDGRIIAWGMAFDDDDRAEVVGADFRSRGSFSSAERAQRLYSRRRKIRLVWTSTPATRPANNLAS